MTDLLAGFGGFGAAPGPTPEPPGHLSEAAAGVWRDVAAAMLAEGRTVHQVEAYSVLVARLRAAQERVDREGMIVADDRGRPVPHPALLIERECRADLRLWSR